MNRHSANMLEECLTIREASQETNIICAL